MRLVMRFLLVEFTLAWAMTLAGFIRAGVQAWPFLAGSVKVGARAWRRGLTLALGFPVVAGWPLLFWLRQADAGYRGWLRAIAIPWWIVLGGLALAVLLGRLGSAAEARERGQTIEPGSGR